MSALRSFLLGGQGIASTDRMLSGLSREVALRPVSGLPYTLYGLLWHIECCQSILLKQLAGQDAPWPPAAEQWPQGAPDEAAWEQLLVRLKAGLAEAAQRAAEPTRLPEAERDLLEDLCAHNAYHWGQVVTLRRLLNDWAEEA